MKGRIYISVSLFKILDIVFVCLVSYNIGGRYLDLPLLYLVPLFLEER